jgi:hypothetical protein
MFMWLLKSSFKVLPKGQLFFNSAFTPKVSTPFNLLQSIFGKGIRYLLNTISKSLHQHYFSINPSLGFATKARACKGAGQEGSMGVTFHGLGNVGKCEGMNPRTLKWAPILGFGVPMDFQNFKEQLQGSKPIGLRISLYHWKDLEM